MDTLLAPLFDSWDRNQQILVNLLELTPKEAFDLEGASGSELRRTKTLRAVR